MKQKYLLYLTLILGLLGTFSLIGTIASYSIFNVSETPSVTNLSSESTLKLQCHQETSVTAIDNNGQLDVLVWNIYKQNRLNWHEALTAFSQSAQLILLQEASMTESLKGWVLDKGWQGNQVEAFKAFDVSSGVLTIAASSPALACAYLELEPWLRLPKSALYSLYQLSNGEMLAVVNIHAVNFTYGVGEYHHQLEVLAKELTQHEGPIILAGDFNSWNEERVAELNQVVEFLGLEAATFSPDHRKQFVNGLALDHVFYRGLSLKTAEAPLSDASDHNPLLVSFSLQ
ncbi:endonuclease/exonuclease/phosphatase family protein [Vibrio kyushuensis]|uniref:endonuclease/exonuclease/phosphatase family protein n=1 Tax=Vibrio kyushuensis TaxID=2910249 RepID=UPI003D11D59E